MHFSDQYKFYKNNNASLYIKDISNFDEPNIKENNYFKPISIHHSNISWEKSFGMKNPHEWNAYEIVNKPGLIVIKNPFYFSGQRYWIMRCLKYFTRKPNKLNIDAHFLIDPTEDWWEYSQRMKNTQTGAAVLKKLRWATFGYHHDWDTKEYSESSKCEFPDDLNVFCKQLGDVFNFSNFNAEAAIINTYHFGSTLCPHSDHSELNLSAPLFSFSFGQSAIFLIGGKTLEDEVIPIVVKSGDIIIMSGESRLFYHAVPKILPAELETWNINNGNFNIEWDNNYLLKEVTDQLLINKVWEPFNSYVAKSRINMNIRQVLHSGQKTLN